MARHTLYKYHPKYVRDMLNLAINKSDEIQKQEKELLAILLEIDKHRLYGRHGFKSLRGFCIFGLKFSKTQAQRLATDARRLKTTGNIGQNIGTADFHDSKKFHAQQFDLFQN